MTQIQVPNEPNHQEIFAGVEDFYSGVFDDRWEAM